MVYQNARYQNVKNRRFCRNYTWTTFFHAFYVICGYVGAGMGFSDDRHERSQILLVIHDYLGKVLPCSFPERLPQAVWTNWVHLAGLRETALPPTRSAAELFAANIIIQVFPLILSPFVLYSRWCCLMTVRYHLYCNLFNFPSNSLPVFLIFCVIAFWCLRL